MSTWVKNHRKIQDWKYYKKDGYAHLWQHLLRQAHHGATPIFDNFGNEIKKGMFSTGRMRLAKETGLSASKVERILKKLEIGQQIEQQKTTKCRVITITNWKDYQGKNTEPDNKRTTSGQQADNKRTQNKNVKNVKNEENVKNIYTQEKDIITFWNSFNIIKHVASRPLMKRLQTKMNSLKKEGFTIRDIEEAITRYAKIVNGPEYFFNYKWPLVDFLGRENARKFYGENFVIDNFKGNSAKSTAQEIQDRMINMENPYVER